MSGHADGMKRYIGYNSSIPRHNHVREEVGGHLQLLTLKN